VPRVRVASAPIGELPRELTDRHDPLWESIPRVKAWLVKHGVAGFDVAAHGPLNRHALAVRGWVQSHDWVRVSTAGHRNPDWARLRAAGVPPGCAAVILERMERAGVRVE
jgi:hypothetical protein